MGRSSIGLITLAIVLTSSSGCVQARNILADRDLVCRETPDDLCMRIADLGLTRMDVDAEEHNVGRIPTIQVYPSDCQAEFGAPAAVRCWSVEATAESGAGIGVGVYQQADGSIHAY